MFHPHRLHEGGPGRLGGLRSTNSVQSIQTAAPGRLPAGELHSQGKPRAVVRQGLQRREFRRCGFAEAAAGPATRLSISVEAPLTSHELTVRKLSDWLEGGGRTPSEQALKVLSNR